jgi:hypothetical protein
MLLCVAVQVANRLFDVNIVAADGEVPVWHPDVRFFKVMQVRIDREHWVGVVLEWRGGCLGRGCHRPVTACSLIIQYATMHTAACLPYPGCVLQW